MLNMIKFLDCILFICDRYLITVLFFIKEFSVFFKVLYWEKRFDLMINKKRVQKQTVNSPFNTQLYKDNV